MCLYHSALTIALATLLAPGMAAAETRGFEHPFDAHLGASAVVDVSFFEVEVTARPSSTVEVEAENAPRVAVLQGTVEGTPVSELALTLDRKRQTARLDAAGSFRFSVEIVGPRYVDLELDGREKESVTVYLVPGQTVSLSCQAAEPLGSLRFTGAGAIENSVLARLADRYGKIEYRRLFSSAPKQFEDLVLAQQKELESLLAESSASHPELDAGFLRLERARIQYWGALLRVKRLGLSGNWGAFAAGLRFDDPSLLAVDTYSSFLFDYIKAKAAARLASDAMLRKSINQQTEARYAVVLESFADPTVRSFALFEVLHNHFGPDDDGPFGCKGIDDLMARFARDNKDPQQRAEIEREYRQCLEGRNAPVIRPYKVAAGVSLDAHVFPAAGAVPGDRRPAFLFFHGGGWAAGIPEWGYDRCRYYAERGLVGVSFEYRLRWRHGTSPIESVQDAKSAVRWVRAHAAELGVDPDRIVVAGFSAGGHLAASTALVPRNDEPADDPAVSPVPMAMVLMSAAVDVADDGWVRECLAGRGDQRELSPAQQIRGVAPPAIVFHGRQDHLCPFVKTVAFCDKLKAAGGRCDLHDFPGGHFRDSGEWETITAKTNEFLTSLGLLAPAVR